MSTPIKFYFADPAYVLYDSLGRERLGSRCGFLVRNAMYNCHLTRGGWPRSSGTEVLEKDTHI